MSEASSGSGSPQSSTGLSNTNKVMEESCGDVCVCILTEMKKKTLPKGHTSDFCGLTNFFLPKKILKNIFKEKLENWTSLGTKGRGPF